METIVLYKSYFGLENILLKATKNKKEVSRKYFLQRQTLARIFSNLVDSQSQNMAAVVLHKREVTSNNSS